MRDRFIRELISIPVISDLFFLVINFYSKINHNSDYLKEESIQSKPNSDTNQWFIRISAPRNPSSKLWGDFYFAKEIQSSLAKLGIGSQILFRGDRKPLPKNSINLVIRGVYPSKPVHGVINVLWVISHPNQVSKKEIQGFDFVFAASQHWAKEKSRIWQKTIDVLLQATNPDLFFPKIKSENPNDFRIIFIGNAIDRKREVVLDVIKLGYGVEVYGAGWEQIIPKHMIKAGYVPNSDVAELYRSASIVISDHWRDMRSNGFISNRVYDAISTNTKVISDNVLEVNEDMYDYFYTYSNLGELKNNLEKIRKNNDVQDIDFAVQFGKMNSFDNRVSQLLQKVNKK